MAKNSRKSRVKAKEVDIVRDIEPQLTKKFHQKDLIRITPKTKNQRGLFDSWYSELETDMCYALFGSAGTGKSFLSMYLALELLLSDETFEKIYIIRANSPSREVGHLPGTLEEKMEAYEAPYVGICDELFKFKKSYENLKKLGKIEFLSTSFLRGMTLNNCIVIADEVQNNSFEESSTILSRVGNNCKLFMCGDFAQNDLHFKKSDVSGFDKLYEVVVNMHKYFTMIEFSTDDIVRSGFVKDFIIAKERLGY